MITPVAPPYGEALTIKPSTNGVKARMSGIRRCDQCGNLFKIQNDGPEAMRADGTFPRHRCAKCTDPVGFSIGKAIEASPEIVEQVKAGRSDLSPLLGKVMTDLRGAANPALVTEELKRRLGVT